MYTSNKDSTVVYKLDEIFFIVTYIILTLHLHFNLEIVLNLSHVKINCCTNKNDRIKSTEFLRLS